MNRLIKFYRDLKFKKKLLISYSVIIIIPVVVLGVFSYVQAKNFLLQQAKQGIHDSVKQMALIIDGKIRSCNSAMDFMALNTQLLDIINNDYYSIYDLYVDYNEFIDSFFNSILFMNTDIKKISIYTGNNIPERGIAEGTNTATSSVSILSIERVRNEKWFDETMENGALKWYRSEDKIFAVRRLVKQYKNSKLNIAYMELHADSLFDIFQDNKFNKSGIFICDNKGQILFSQSPYGMINEPGTEKIFEGIQGDMNVNGVKYLLIKMEMPELTGTLYYYTPIDSITVDARTIISATVIIVFCCIIVLILITWFFSISFENRIRRLNEKIDFIEEGHLNIEVQSQSSDEIGELTNKFGKMVKRINTLIEEVVHSRTIQKEAEFKALQAQINPHFLYNSLSLINWKAKLLGAEDISQVAVLLSRFYRKMLNKGDSYIFIKDEIENTVAYIKIQQIMHDYNFDVIYEINEDILYYHMINVTLQPIVENAIEHGILNIKAGKGKLIITGSMKNDLIEFTVEDNGAGMCEELLSKTLAKDSRGYGLKNVHDRIRLYFGEEYGLEIKSKEGTGTVVRVILPKYKNS